MLKVHVVNCVNMKIQTKRRPSCGVLYSKWCLFTYYLSWLVLRKMVKLREVKISEIDRKTIDSDIKGVF